MTDEELEETFQRLARRGLIYDTGQKRWGNQSHEYQIVWAARSPCVCNCGYDAEKCLSRDCAHEHALFDGGTG